MDWDVFATLTTVSIIAIVSPGPDFLIVSPTSLFHSKEAALWAICGMAIGSLIHMSYIFWGLGHLPHESFLFRILHVCGAGYLFWLGCCSLSTEGKEIFQTMAPVSSVSVSLPPFDLPSVPTVHIESSTQDLSAAFIPDPRSPQTLTEQMPPKILSFYPPNLQKK